MQIYKDYTEFTVNSSRELQFLNSVVAQITHKKTGLKILYLKNDDKNKVFFTAFRTPPYNNNGVAHILEHSVLCGSKNYKVKDLFNELSKGSINTYLNALTFSDKTIYPAASQNEKDFFNLTEAYLDAVFNPLIYETPEFFCQEGWNYKLNGKDEAITINGIVYNEMKGAYAQPERILIKKTDEVLFKNTPYEFDSGGSPSFIHSLSFEQFLHFHKTYYSPSNCLIYLYGDLDIRKALDLISTSIQNYDKTVIPAITFSSDFDDISQIRKYYYSVNKTVKDGAYYAISYPCCNYTDYKTVIALEILGYILSGHDAAPIRKAVQNSGICGDFSSYYRTSSYTTSFSFIAKNAKDDKFDIFEKIIADTISGLALNGISKELIKGALNKWEFSINEDEHGGRPKGLAYGILAASSWVYGGDGYDALRIKETFSDIKNEPDIFDKLLSKYLADSMNYTRTVLLPKEKLIDEQEKDLAVKLDKYKSNLSYKELDDLVNNSKRLEHFKAEPPPKAELDKVPVLKTTDISTKIQGLQYSITDEGVTTLHNKDEIEYINLHFNCADINKELIPYLGLLREILLKTDTEHYSADMLINEINIYSGGIYCITDVLQNTDGSFIPRFSIKAKSLSKNTQKVIALIKEAIRPKLNNEKVTQIYKETITKMESYFTSSGHIIAANRGLSQLFPSYMYSDLISGIGFYRSLYGKSADQLIENLYKVINFVFLKKNLLIGAALHKDKPEIPKEITAFYDCLNGDRTGFAENIRRIPALTSRGALVNEGFIIDSSVSYNAKAFNIYETLTEYSGGLLVAKSALSLDYMWSEIRNKGGAYGCGASFSRNGVGYFFSYRDPEIGGTYSTFDNCYDFLKRLNISERDFSKYVINAIKPFERPLCPEEDIDNAVKYHILGISEQMRQKEREEILSTKIKDINNIGDLLSETKGSVVCTLGTSSKVSSEKLFNTAEILRLTV